MGRLKHYHDGPLECWSCRGFVCQKQRDIFRFTSTHTADELADFIIGFYQARGFELVERSCVIRLTRRGSTALSGTILPLDIVVTVGRDAAGLARATLSYQPPKLAETVIVAGGSPWKKQMRQLVTHIQGEEAGAIFAEAGARWRRRIAIVLATLVTLAIGSGILRLAPHTAPMQPGSSTDFWAAACCVELGDEPISGYGGYVVRLDDRFFYSHDFASATLRYVPVSEAMADFHRALDKLAEEARTFTEEYPTVAGYLRWMNTPEDRRNGAEGLIWAIQAARYRKADADFSEYAGPQRRNQLIVQQRITKAKRYWVNPLFEFVWLSGLVWLAMWPAIKGSRPWRWALHIGLLPLLLALPAYLGYFHSSWVSIHVAPSGGVLYPWVIVFFQIGQLGPLDEAIVRHLPRMLEPLSQEVGPFPIDAYRRMLGPTMLLKIGVMLACITMAIRCMRQRATAWMEPLGQEHCGLAG